MLKDVSAAKSLFLGTLVEENLFPFPAVQPAEVETLRMVLDSIDKFMSPKAEHYREYDKKGEQPEAYLQELREMGLFGLIIPEEHGGVGFSNTAYSRVLQQASRYDASTSLTIGAHSSIGLKGVVLFGTEEQKKKYLPRLASGELIAAFCLTEPGAGSDAASIKTNAVLQSDGSWLLNGDKLWITNGPTAGLFTVFARTDGEAGKMTGFIVERAYPGVSSGPKEDKMGIRASATSTVTFNNVRVPAENVLGGVGQGFKVAMAILNNGRTGLGGGCVGAMKRCLNLAIKQSEDRKQFGTSINQFGLMKEKITQMTVVCFAAESVVNLVAGYIDNGCDDYSTEAAISKIYATEALWTVANESLQVAGGNGFMKEYPYEGVVRDCRINMIFEGTNEILRLYVGLSGLKDAGESLAAVKKSAGKMFDDPIKGFGVLSKFATRKVSQLTSFGRPRLTAFAACLKDEAEIYELFTQRFSKANDALLMKFGKKIIGEQLYTRRVADIAIDLFVGLSVLSRVTAIVKAVGEKQAADEISIAKIYTAQAKRRMKFNLQRLITNEDGLTNDLSDSMIKKGEYRWDIV